jgi:hypothetical protein
LGPIEEWLTYQEELRRVGPKTQLVLFHARADFEIEARAKQRKATKNNQTAESRAEK